MLDPWIIVEIRRQEQTREQTQSEHPVLEMPLIPELPPEERRRDERSRDREDTVGRGVVIIEGLW